MVEILNFIDQHQNEYTVICLLTFLLFLIVTVTPFLSKKELSSKQKKWIFNGNLFIGLMLLTVAIARLPIILYFVELNPDESLYLAEAITAKEKIFFWKYIDCTTHGPLDIYPIIFFSFGGAINYFTIRITRLFCVLGMLLFTYFAKKELFGANIAKVGMIPVVSFSAFYKYNDFTSYSSEHVPILCFSLVLFLMAKLYTATTLNRKQIFGIGLLLGAIPFTKLQAVPIALILTFFTYLLIWQKENFSFQNSLSNFFALTIGGLLVPILFFISIITTGALESFWQMYYLSNFGYSYGSTGANFLEQIQQWVIAYTGKFANVFWIIFSILILMLSIFFKKNGFTKKSQVYLLAFLISFFSISLFSALKPGGFFPHYLLLLILPLTYLFTFLIYELYTISHKEYDIKRLVNLQAIGLVSLVFLFALGQQFGFINKSALLNNKLFGNLEKTYSNAQNSPNTQLILNNSDKEDSMMIWGWEAKYYTWTQRHMATPYSYIYSFHAEYIPETSKNFHKKNFLDHFKKNQPKIFIDAIGPGNYYKDKEKYGFEKFLPLAELIAEQYVQIAQQDNVSIYKRK